MKALRLSLFCGVLLGFFSTISKRSDASNFVKDIEKDFSLRSFGHLQVTNSRGDIVVQGWSFDKIRIKLRKRVVADSADQANVLFATTDYRYDVSPQGVEISAEYGKGLGLLDRLHEQEQPHSIIDMTILAPSSLKLRIWSSGGGIVLKSWSASAEIRSGAGRVRIEGVKADTLELVCPACTGQLRNIQASIRCLGGSGQVELGHIHGKSIVVETDSGGIKLFQVQGNQLYISRSGLIEGQSLTGGVEFSAQQGNVNFQDVSGFLSGSLDSGNFVGNVKNWKFSDKAFIESGRGNIDLTLPQHFSAEVDIWSNYGKTAIDFAIDKSQDRVTFGPEPANHWIGRIRDGGELLKIFTDRGDIHVFKGK